MDILELRNKLRSEWMDLTAGWKMRNPGSVSKTCQQKISKQIKEREKWGKAQMQHKGETCSKCLMCM